jgi:hypothetical protein
MKKITVILFALVLASCSKSKTDEAVVPEVPKNILELKDPELDYYGVPNKSVLNIQVGELIKVKLEITKLTGAKVIVATPESKAVSFHALFNTDYELYVLSTTEIGKYSKVEFLNLIEGVNQFFIKPLIPGTFQIQLEDKTKIYNFPKPITFSAVKITTRTDTGLDGNCGLKRWHHRNFFFTINSGDQTYDNFFKEDKAVFTYSTNYNGSAKSDNFAPNTELNIIDPRNECGNDPGLPTNITSITVTKTVGDIKTISTYYNIPIN